MTGELYLFDGQLNLESVIPQCKVIENFQELELNGLITANATSKYKEKIEQASYFGQKENDNFWIYKKRGYKKEGKRITIYGIHMLFDDLKGKVIRDIRPTNVTAAQALAQILSNTGWSLGVSTAQKVTSSNFYYQSTLSAFFDFIEKWECEFIPKIKIVDGVITEKSIDIHDHISSDYGKWFEYGDKLLSVVEKQNNDNLYTAFIGRGKGEETEGGGFARKIKFDDIGWSIANGNPVNKPIGQDYVEMSEATAVYGYPDGTPRIGVIDFDDIEDPNELLQATYNYTVENARPKVHLKSKGTTRDPVELGETVAVIRSDINIRYKTRIFKIKKDFINNHVTDFEFGDKVTVSSAERIKSSESKKKKEQEKNESRFEYILSQITSSYWGKDGYNYDLKVGNPYGLPAGLYSFDKPIDQSPTEVIYVGAGRMLISNKKDPNGQWVWRTAATPEGLVGSEIIANSITANKLSSDVGQSLDLSSNESITSKVTSTIVNYVQDHKDELKGDTGAQGPTGPKGDTGPRGLQGIQGPAGADGKPTYTWIRYADTPTTGISSTPTNKNYIGIASNKASPNPSSNYSDYLWSLVKGPPGADGNDGNSNFTWIKYADDNKGTGMNDSPNGKRWLGVAPNKKTSLESNDWRDYTWSPLYDNSVIMASTSPSSPNHAQLWLDTSTNPNLIKRWDGSKWVTVSDLTQLEELVASKASQSDLDSQIANVVSSIQASLDSEISQTNSTFNIKFSETIGAINAAGDRISALSSEIETNIRFTADGIELGKSTNPVSVKILPDRVSFTEGGQEVAYFSNNKLYVTDIHVLTSLRIGDFAFFPRASGNLSFRKVT